MDPKQQVSFLWNLQEPYKPSKADLEVAEQWTELDWSYLDLQILPMTMPLCTRLKVFDISGNNLESLHAVAFKLKTLEDLDLSANKITEVHSSLSMLTGLKELNLSSNYLTAFPVSIRELVNMEVLYLSHNKIKEIPGEISSLVKLKTFYINSNSLTHLPFELEEISSLRFINAKNNPLIQPPTAVCDSGSDAILRYLRNAREKAVRACRLQLNILGEVCAGKSSLVKSLTTEKPHLTAEEDRTCVLDQLLWEEEDVTFNINDFGGHEIYRVVHNFFLAKDGLTLLVFNIALYETSNFHALIGQWIETLCMRVPEAMIALVGTHIDECGREVAESKSQDVLERADKFIQEKTGERNTKEKIQIVVQKTFPDAITEKETKRRRQFGIYLVDQIFLVSSKNLEGFDLLKEKLIQVAKTKALILPQSWLAVSKFVQKAKSERTDCNCLSVQELSREYSSIIRKSSEKVKKAGASRRENQEKVGRSKTTKDIKPKKPSFFSHTLQKLQRAFSPRQAKTAQASSKSTTENQDEPSDETEAEDIQLQMILDTLHFLRKTGEVLWFPENSFLLNIVFHNQDVVIDLLKAVFRHDMEDELQYDKAPFRTEYTHPRFINEREDLLKRGILSRKMIACLWEKFGLKNTEIDAMIELMLKFDLCYDVSVQETEEEVDSTRASHFHIPWLLRETRPGDVMLQWPASLPSDHVQLTLEYHFPNSCPIGLYEMAAVRLHRYLGPFKTTRIDWTDGVVAQVEQGFLNMERRETATGGLIMVAIRGRNVSDLWPHTVKLHDEMVEILEQECPGSRCDAYLVCPHCVAAGFQDPTLFPAEVLTSPPPMTLSVVPCLRSANGKVPAYLVYPNAQDQGIMTADHRRALRAHRVRLVEDISSPSALDILNRLYAAAIITEREMVTMRSADLKYDMVEVLLDILPGKGDRAFGEFVTGLECCGYGDIARLLKYQFKF